MTPSGGDEIARRDELLELLYWIEGEGFVGSATLESIVRFVARDRDNVVATLDRLAALDLVSVRGGEYRLTTLGRTEAARRFAEEFAPLLAQGHGECNDPECDCHTNPGGSAECRARAHATTGERH